jgi:endonuclease YncB( thermonuclease family)
MARSFAGHKPGSAGRRPIRRSNARFAAGRWIGRYCGFLALAALLVLGSGRPDVSPSHIVSLWQPSQATAVTTTRPFPICSTGARVDCIVDGDTFWFAGQKIRIADFDTPEIFSPTCRRELELGEKA